MSRFLLCVGLLLNAHGLVVAEAKYVVDSDVEATVLLDGKRVGRTPITLKNIPAGTHRLEIRDPRTQRSVVEEITSPEGFTVEKALFMPFREGRRVSSRARIHRDRERMQRYDDDDDDDDGAILGAALLGGAIGLGGRRGGYWGGGYPCHGGIYPYYGLPRRGLSVSFGFGGGFGGGYWGGGYPYYPGYWY